MFTHLQGFTCSSHTTTHNPSNPPHTRTHISHTHTHTHMHTHTHTHTHTGDDDAAEILKELSSLEAKYFTLGLCLHLSSGKVEEIQENNPHSCGNALSHVIVEWLKLNYDHPKHGRPTWGMLVDAVNAIDHDRAKLIASKHIKVYVFPLY